MSPKEGYVRPIPDHFYIDKTDYDAQEGPDGRMIYSLYDNVAYKYHVISAVEYDEAWENYKRRYAKHDPRGNSKTV